MNVAQKVAQQQPLTEGQAVKIAVHRGNTYTVHAVEVVTRGGSRFLFYRLRTEAGEVLPARYTRTDLVLVADAAHPYLARTGNRGHGTTHLYRTAGSTYKVHGIRYTNTHKALCGAIASSAAVLLGRVADMPWDATKPCGKCTAAVAR